MTVAASHRIASRMQRLRLTGENLSRFNTFANLHIRLYVPRDSSETLPRPVLSSYGRPVLSNQLDCYVMRYYTIRDIDAEAGWIDIDFVLHEDTGPACDFARCAQPGDICGISGPCGKSVKPAKHYLLAGDETALPAIARITKSLPDDAKGLILIDTHDAVGMPEFTNPSGMAQRWISRRPGQKSESYIKSVCRAIGETATATNDHFIWIAGEYSDCAALRPHLGKIHKSRHINVSYWRASSALETDK
ncbi:siderophore-interacting protein [Ochrobactrum sp. S46]|nr:siderophore-interacting protein [Ochrobactrum sp. S45]MBK0044921.1 siderophore-interacting protein [Ochrobactrum sp. S46]